MELTWILTFLLAIILKIDNTSSDPISITAKEEDNYVASLIKELDKLAWDGIKSDKLVKYLAELALENKIRNTDLEIYINERSSLACTMCKSFVKTVFGYFNDGIGEDRIINLLNDLCVSLNIQTEKVCNGVIALNAPIVFYILKNKPNIEPQSVCGLLLKSSASCPIIDDEFEWSIEIEDYLEGEKYLPPPPSLGDEKVNGEELRIVQLSDFHYDPAYQVNGNAFCDEPTCCRLGQNHTNEEGHKLSGYWGDYNDCDMPWHAIVDAVDVVKRNENNIDYIYYTGDVIDHGVWETTRSGNIESIIKTYTLLKDTFGDLPIFPIIGNHETNPMNVFAPADVNDDKLSTKWLYELLADIWIDFRWLPESTRSTILQGGFYSFSPKPGFRIVALNNNICYIYNWWLLYAPQDPTGQLKWLSETLLRAEKEGEYVHILAHAPPGSDCIQTWGREYRKIVNRFSKIVKAEFNGHTHNDEFRLIYDLEETAKPVRVSWIGGSVTTYSFLNPNYRVYKVDSETYEVEDSETWIYNLTLANLKPGQRPVWFKSYSFKEEYGLDDLSLNSLDRLIHRMAKNSTILQTYHGHYVKQADPELAKGCDEGCRYKQLCKIVTAVKADNTQCEYFKNLS